MTAASFKDAARYLVGAKNYEHTWAKIELEANSDSTDKASGPGPRGWFGVSQGQDLGPGSIVLWGGLSEDNSRLADGWILNLDF